jgi:CheY-like chemotaxis protein
MFAIRRVLLFDTDQKRRDGRADQLRSRGIEVLCAADEVEARLMWSENSYRLVLVDANDSPQAIQFTEEVRAANPKQMVAFFVGKPGYLASAPNLPVDLDEESETGPEFGDRVDRYCEGLGQRYGFREASLRILAARMSKRRMDGNSSSVRLAAALKTLRNM